MHPLTEPQALDLMSQTMKDIPECDVLLAGFPCRDFSKLSPTASSRKSCLVVGSHSSGGGFYGMFDYVEKKKRPRVLLLENVASTTFPLA